MLITAICLKMSGVLKLAITQRVCEMTAPEDYLNGRYELSNTMRFLWPTRYIGGSEYTVIPQSVFHTSTKLGPLTALIQFVINSILN